MRNLILSLLFTSFSFFAYSQELAVKSFQLNEGDLSARTEKRLDSNGNQCALIKVEVIPACEFGGYVIGSVEKKLGAYWVYVCAKNPITRKLIVSSDNFQPLEVDFSKFGITSIEAGFTYTLRIESINQVGINIMGGHKYVDLGLSAYWSDCNLGALKPHQLGDKYAWGINFSTNDTIDVKNICGTKYDAVSQLWGGDWRMPTSEELSELLNNCIIYDDKENDVIGKRCIGPSGNSIFIPYTNISRNPKDSTEKYETTLWAGNKNQNYVLKVGYAPYVLNISNSRIVMFPYRDVTTERYFRPVVSHGKEIDYNQYWGTPTNNRYLIKGQIVSAIENQPETLTVNIYDNASGKLLQQVVNDKGLFEIWVYKDQELRFEYADGSDSKPIIKNAAPIMKIYLLHTATFGLAQFIE